MDAHDIITVESLNPRGRVVKEIEMSVKRARGLSTICYLALKNLRTVARARATHPWQGDYPVPNPLLRFVFGEPLYAAERLCSPWWPWFFDTWYSGRLEHMERVALTNLPEKVKEKLRVELDQGD